MEFIFLSGEMHPLHVDSEDRRFFVVNEQTGSMHSTPAVRVVGEETDGGIAIRGVADQKVSQGNGLVNGEVENQPAQPLISQVETDTTVLERDSHK